MAGPPELLLELEEELEEELLELLLEELEELLVEELLPDEPPELSPPEDPPPPQAARDRVKSAINRWRVGKAIGAMRIPFQFYWSCLYPGAAGSLEPANL